MIHTLLAYCFSWQIVNDPEHEELTVYENNLYFKGVERFRHHSKHHNLQKLQNYCNVKVKHLRRANEVKYREGYRKWFMLVYTLLKTLQLLTKTLLRNKKNPFTTFANKAEKNWWWCAVAVTLLELTLISTANPLTTLVWVPISYSEIPGFTDCFPFTSFTIRIKLYWVCHWYTYARITFDNLCILVHVNHLYGCFPD